MKIKTLGNIINLFISKKDFVDRINQSELIIDTDGVFIDKFYGQNTNRSVLITSLGSYEIAKQNGIDIHHGQLGENILIDFNLNMLELNKQFKIGDVILEISQQCTICNSLSKIDEKLPKLLEHDRGVFAKVIHGGIIKNGDKVEIIN